MLESLTVNGFDVDGYLFGTEYYLSVSITTYTIMPRTYTLPSPQETSPLSVINVSAIPIRGIGCEIPL